MRQKNCMQVFLSIPNDVYAFVSERAALDVRNVRSQCLYYLLKGIEQEGKWKGPLKGGRQVAGKDDPA
jgi:hypothetical protein